MTMQMPDMMVTIGNWIVISLGVTFLLAGFVSIRWAPNAYLPTGFLWTGLVLLAAWVLVKWVF